MPDAAGSVRDEKESRAMNRHVMLCRIAAVVLGCICSAAFAGEAASSEAASEELVAESERIDSANAALQPGSGNDLAQYERLAEEIDAKWRGRDRRQYGRLMLGVVWPLASGRFADDRQHDLALRYILSVLETPDDVDLDVEVRLAGFLTLETNGRLETRDANWTGMRLRFLKLRIHAWQRLLSEVDPAWKAEDQDGLRQEWMSAVTADAQRSSDAADTPAAREERRFLIQGLHDKMIRWEYQYRVREMLAGFALTAANRIQAEYSTTPYNFGELEAQVAGLTLLKPEERTRILENAREMARSRPE